MVCTICEKNLTDCKCDDIEDRLEDAVKSGHFDYKKCARCGKHYDRCKCKKPVWIKASMYLTLKKMGAL